MNALSPSTRRTTRVGSAAALVLGVLTAASALTALPAAAHPGHPDAGGDHAAVGTAALGPEAARAVARARAATSGYHRAAAAVAAGYLPTDVCVPGMGQHWVNPANMADGVHDPSRPDLLLYAPVAGGGLRLVGAEWFQPDADQRLDTDEDRPSMAGLPFDGPMTGHEPGMPVHYDLHLYLWERNPDGIASPSNPRVTC